MSIPDEKNVNKRETRHKQHWTTDPFCREPP